VTVDTREFADLRLADARHAYKAQGRTVDRAFVLTGGWQTDRERSYVALTRAQDRADIYVSREDLGEQGMDAGAIEHLGQAVTASHAQEPSVARAEETYSSQEIVLALDVQHNREHELGRGIE
jgi:ATP-dependent exoDNAse (exonuclease V) alpha subunit